MICTACYAQMQPFSIVLFHERKDGYVCTGKDCDRWIYKRTKIRRKKDEKKHSR